MTVRPKGRHSAKRRTVSLPSRSHFKITITSYDGQLLTCVRRVLSYTWHCKRRALGWCVCVCVTMKKVPDEWQAQQAIPAILQGTSSKHNAKKNTTTTSIVNHIPPWYRRNLES